MACTLQTADKAWVSRESPVRFRVPLRDEETGSRHELGSSQTTESQDFGIRALLTQWIRMAGGHSQGSVPTFWTP